MSSSDIADRISCTFFAERFCLRSPVPGMSSMESGKITFNEEEKRGEEGRRGEKRGERKHLSCEYTRLIMYMRSTHATTRDNTPLQHARENTPLQHARENTPLQHTTAAHHCSTTLHTTNATTHLSSLTDYT